MLLDAALFILPRLLLASAHQAVQALTTTAGSVCLHCNLCSLSAAAFQFCSLSTLCHLFLCLSCVQAICCLHRYMNSFEAALFGPAFLDPVDGWRKYASILTFTDWFLTHEIIKNAKHTYHGTSFTNKVCAQLRVTAKQLTACHHCKFGTVPGPKSMFFLLVTSQCKAQKATTGS